MKKISFIGVGVNKCGTTWLYQQLAAHPEVCVSKQKETHYFARAYNPDSTWYEQQFDHCKPGQITGEFSPEYLHDPQALERIKSHLPETKILVALRHPIDRLRSSWEFDYNRGAHGYRRFKDYADHAHPVKKEQSFYAPYLEKLYTLFPAEQIHVILFDDIRDNPSVVLNDLFSFLEVDPSLHTRNVSEKSNDSKKVSTRYPIINRTLFRIRRFFKRTRFGNIFVRPLKAIGINAIANLIFAYNRGGKTASDTLDSQLTEEERAQLWEEFLPDVKATGRLLGTTLTDRWK